MLHLVQANCRTLQATEPEKRGSGMFGFAKLRCEPVGCDVQEELFQALGTRLGELLEVREHFGRRIRASCSFRDRIKSTSLVLSSPDKMFVEGQAWFCCLNRFPVRIGPLSILQASGNKTKKAPIIRLHIWFRVICALQPPTTLDAAISRSC